MRVLVSTIGTRGDVQPVVALASELRALGHEARVCAPPDFRDWIEGLGIPYTALGVEVRKAASARQQGMPSPEQLRQQIQDTITNQFSTLTEAGKDCDVIVGCNGIQVGARSVTEILGINYVFAAYCAVSLPSPHHAPPPMAGQKPVEGTADNPTLWARFTQRSNALWGEALNSCRAEAGLAPVTDVPRHVDTDQPWLAADSTLGPWLEPSDLDVVQTGAWILPDPRPLSPEIEEFLAGGEPPVYFGFGSIRTPDNLAENMINSARALGRRAIVLKGWADLSPLDDQPDCLSIGEVNQQALFKRVAAVVHHGGAGTTHAAARAGVPQVVIPQHYDQPYWAKQVDRLGIGIAHQGSVPTAESLTAALGRAIQAEVADRAQVIAGKVRGDGANVAAQRLLAL